MRRHTLCPSAQGGRFDFKSSRTIARIANLILDISATAHVFGLGYSLVEVREHTIGIDSRLWVLATPIDGTLVDLSLVSQVREIRKPGRKLAGLGFLPVKWSAPVMNRFLASQQRRDVLQDVAIWSRNRYRSHPRLCRSDGKIMPFRHYCAQFYSEPCDSGGPTP